MFKLTKLDAAYHKEIVLHNLNATVTHTGVTTIIGPNGSGKSTLLKCLAKLIPTTHGAILLNNEAIHSMSVTEYAKRVSYLSQTREVPNTTVEMLVSHGRFPYVGFYKKLATHDHMKIQDAMQLANIVHLRHKMLNHLSGGEKQKAYLAMILAQDTPIILLDEPTTFLDLHHQLEFLDLVKQLSKHKKIVMVLHDLNQAFTYSDEIILLHQGQLIAQDIPSQIINSNHIETVFGLKTTVIEHGSKTYYYFNKA